MKAEIEIPEGKQAAWKDGVLTLVDNNTPKEGGITERVKSFSDAVAELGGDHPDVILYLKLDKEENELPKDVRAYLMLRIIAAALNEGWRPTYRYSEHRYVPWFDIDDGGNFIRAEAIVNSAFMSTLASSHVVLKSKELALYEVFEFKHIWKDFLLE